MEDTQSAQAIQAQLEELRQNQAALEQALEQRKKTEQKGFVAELRQMILDRGYQPDEISALLGSGKRQRGGKGSPKTTSNYPTYANPDNPEQVYTRGRRPNWFTEKMIAHGFDPENAEQRQQFKEQHLIKVTD